MQRGGGQVLLQDGLHLTSLASLQNVQTGSEEG